MRFFSWRAKSLSPIESDAVAAAASTAPAPGARRGWLSPVARLAAGAALVGALAGAATGIYVSGDGRFAGPLATPPPVLAARAAGRAAAAQPGDAQSQIKHVIEQANAEQAQAIASRDPSVMADTATAAHLRELTQVNRELLDAGVRRIELLDLTWGQVDVQGATATATTVETWRTTYNNRSQDESRDRNVYALVQDGGTWKIQSNTHPDAGLVIPGVPGMPGIPSAPGSPGQVPPGQVPAPQPAPAPAPALPPSGQSVSRNWAGYAATGGTFTAVHGTWTVPQPDPNGPGGVSAAWVGIGGVRSRDLIQAGTQETVNGNGRTRYSAWIETLPEAAETVPLTVRPGDTITVDITEQAQDTWLVSLTNVTTGQNYHRTVNYASSRSSVEWVEEAPSAGRGVLPLAEFGSIKFSSASAVKDGKSVDLTQLGARPITMVGPAGQALAVPSGVGADGKSFSVDRTDAPATAGGGQGSGVPAFPRPGRRGR